MNKAERPWRLRDGVLAWLYELRVDGSTIAEALPEPFMAATSWSDTEVTRDELNAVLKWLMEVGYVDGTGTMQRVVVRPRLTPHNGRSGCPDNASVGQCRSVATAMARPPSRHSQLRYSGQGSNLLVTATGGDDVTTRRFCERPGSQGLVSPTAGSDRIQYLGWPQDTETHPIVKEMVPIGSNTFSEILRSARRVVAASPVFTANTCTTTSEKSPVICSITGLSGGSLSRIVTTQVTHPGNQGTAGDAFPSSLGMLTHPGT